MSSALYLKFSGTELIGGLQVDDKIFELFQQASKKFLAVPCLEKRFVGMELVRKETDKFIDVEDCSVIHKHLFFSAELIYSFYGQQSIREIMRYNKHGSCSCSLCSIYQETISDLIGIYVRDKIDVKYIPDITSDSYMMYSFVYNCIIHENREAWQQLFIGEVASFNRGLAIGIASKHDKHWFTENIIDGAPNCELHALHVIGFKVALENCFMRMVVYFSNLLDAHKVDEDDIDSITESLSDDNFRWALFDEYASPQLKQKINVPILVS